MDDQSRTYGKIDTLRAVCDCQARNPGDCVCLATEAEASGQRGQALLDELVRVVLARGKVQ
ncbi:MAG: hypothetical protein NW202_13355 [Nitrospira sp.]|nr:hypothetical protein [Nitrospira sp.]